MRKRAGYLIEEIGEMSNLELAWYKAKRGKESKNSVLAFGNDLKKNLAALRDQILNQSIQIGGYKFFTVFEPKKRIICAAPFPQRVLHHAIMNVCHPYFERHQIFDSYASRKSKGTYAALNRSVIFSKRFTWFLKLDVRKYFDTIHHQVLFSQLNRIFKDPSLLKVFSQIINSYSVEPCKGVPIGNLTSQYFANHYLSSADHYCLESLKVPAYVRYMDDMVLWHNDKTALKEAGREFVEFIESKLQQELKPICLNQCAAGLPFLGYLVFPNTIRLSQKSRKRYIKKIRTYKMLLDNEIWGQKQFQVNATALTSFTYFADAKFFRKKVHENYLNSYYE